MRFDVFHSIGRVDSGPAPLSDRQVFDAFFDQAACAESLGFGTMWVAESHFSSEVQKRNPEAVIPHYQGEVGLNADSPQLAAWLFAKTKRIGFGTAIFNIVGGNGGPLGAADRIRTLAFMNAMQAQPRELAIGVASGRFPYINRPFGIVPRNRTEELLWGPCKRLIFAEALEIFLRLSLGEIIGASDLRQHIYTAGLLDDMKQWPALVKELGCDADATGIPYLPRWPFETLKLVPDIDVQRARLSFVLGSADVVARDVGLDFADMDIFNLSFTPPDKIDLTHKEMDSLCRSRSRTWHRGRMPRTVLIFADKDRKKARSMADQAFDTYIEAMRGTVGTPPKEVLLSRALIGDASEIKDQLSPDNPRRFHKDDRLMLWFEFNQTDNDGIQSQMRYFGEKVMPHFA